MLTTISMELSIILLYDVDIFLRAVILLDVLIHFIIVQRLDHQIGDSVSHSAVFGFHSFFDTEKSYHDRDKQKYQKTDRDKKR